MNPEAAASEKTANLGRHRRACTVCKHLECAEIETAFVAWESAASISAQHGIADRSTIYRHAHALGLFEKRRRNIRAALERIIEKAGDVDVTASAVVSAIQAYAKINAAGEWIERTETVSLNQLFERMSATELEEYAQTGTLPAWFRSTVGATAGYSRGGESYGE